MMVEIVGNCIQQVLNKKKPDPLISLKPDKHRMLRLISAHHGRKLQELIDEAIGQYIDGALEKVPTLRQLDGRIN